MAVKDTKLMVFAHLGTAWAPCGQFVLTEEADREAVRAKRLLPANQLPFFGGIRYAGPDADLLSTAPINGATEHRMGFASGLTLTGCDEAEPRTKSYADLAEAVRRRCHPAVIRKDTAELFKRMIQHLREQRRRRRPPQQRLPVRPAPAWLAPQPALRRAAAGPVTEHDKIAPAFRHLDDVSTSALRKRLP